MKKLYVVLVGVLMSSSLALHGVSGAEKLWNKIGSKLADGHFPSEALVADFKAQKGSKEFINRPYYDHEKTMYSRTTILFRATMIIANTWDRKLEDQSFDTLSWINTHLNPAVDMLYSYGARIADDEKESIRSRYEYLAAEIKRMRNNLVSKEFESFTALLKKIGINVTIPTIMNKRR